MTRSLILAEMLGKSRIELPTVLPTDLKQTLEVTAKPTGATQFGTPYVAAHEMQLVDNPGFPPGIATGIGQAWVASGHTNPGGMVVGIYNHTAYFMSDPTAPGIDSSWALGGASISSLPYANTAESIDETINDRVMTPQSVSESFTNNLIEKTVNVSNGAGSAGLSIQLDAAGRIDISMMPTSLTSSLQYRGTFNPTPALEYPASPAVGDMYVLHASHTWAGGSLMGENGNVGDSLIYDATGWSLVGASNASLDPLLPRDGSRPMTGDLGMGGHNLANLGNIQGVLGSSELHNFKIDGIDSTIIMRVFASMPTGLAVGELGVDTTTNRIYVGDASGNAHMLGDHLIPQDDPKDPYGDYLSVTGANALRALLPAVIDPNNPMATLVTKGANTGVADEAARADHDHDDAYLQLVHYIQGGIAGGLILINMLPVGTSSTSVAAGDHTHNNVYEPAFTKNSAFNKLFGAGSHDGTSDDVSRNDHDHDDEYMSFATLATAYNKAFVALSVIGAGSAVTVARGDHDHDADYEPVFSKQDAFNKQFTASGVGTNGIGTKVARDDHKHDEYYHKTSVRSGTGAPTGGAAGDIYFQV